MQTGSWTNLPFGNHIDKVTDYEFAVLTSTELARRIWYVWNKPDKSRTPGDYQFMAWANKCANL